MTFISNVYLYSFFHKWSLCHEVLAMFMFVFRINSSGLILNIIRVKVVTAALIATKVVEEKDVLVEENGEESLIRAVISNVHPLNGRNNAAIVIAFNEASFAQVISLYRGLVA